MGFNAIKVDVG